MDRILTADSSMCVCVCLCLLLCRCAAERFQLGHAFQELQRLCCVYRLVCICVFRYHDYNMSMKSTCTWKCECVYAQKRLNSSTIDFG